MATAAGVVADLEQLIAEKQMQVRLAIPDEARILLADAAKVHDILRNLIENAVNYTPDGGEVDVSVTIKDEIFELIVADTGPGLPAGDLLRVFERFYRVDKSRARPGGTGLGLAIVKHLVQVMDGTVTAGNHPEGGAIFTVRLPVRG
jgi:signal transduction histidine kinase